MSLVTQFARPWLFFSVIRTQLLLSPARQPPPFFFREQSCKVVFSWNGAKPRAGDTAVASQLIPVSYFRFPRVLSGTSKALFLMFAITALGSQLSASLASSGKRVPRSFSPGTSFATFQPAVTTACSVFRAALRLGPHLPVSGCHGGLVGLCCLKPRPPVVAHQFMRCRIPFSPALGSGWARCQPTYARLKEAVGRELERG